jgi:hypothetical protein
MLSPLVCDPCPIILLHWLQVYNLHVRENRCLCSNLRCIPSGIPLGVVLLDHMADLCLVFKDASILFAKVVVLAYIPTSSV